MGTFFAIIWDIIRKSLWPNNAFGLLSRISGALSMAALLVYGFNYDFAPVLLRLFEWWDWFLGALASWTGLGALAQIILAWAGSWFDWDLELHSHWKHVFFLLSVYFFRDAVTSFEVRMPARGIFDLVWGFAVALLASVGAGAVALDHGDPFGDFLVAAIPLAGILAYEFVQAALAATFGRARIAAIFHEPISTWWEEFRGRSGWALGRALVGLVLVAVSFPLARNFDSPGLVLLLLLILLLTLYWLSYGFVDGRSLQAPHESFRTAYWRSGSAKVGAGMLGIFFWTLVFIVTSAGLDLMR